MPRNGRGRPSGLEPVLRISVRATAGSYHFGQRKSPAPRKRSPVKRAPPVHLDMARLPAPPRLPSDWIALLTYQAPQNRVQARRVAESAARAAHVDLESATLAEQL